VQSKTDSHEPGGTRRSWVRGAWTWLSSPNRQRTLTFIGTGVGALVAAIWTGYVYLHEKSSTPTSSVTGSVTGGGVAAGGDITASAGSGGTVVVGSGNVVTIGITLEQYEAGLKRREQEIRSELATVGTQDKQRLTQLQMELADVQGKAHNLEASLADYKAKLAQASEALVQLRRDVPPNDLKQAQQALAQGDTAAAEGLFAKSLAAGKAQAAESAFQLGELAHSRIDYGKAYGDYIDAARLQPENPIYLNRAGRIAHDLGRYQEAQGYLEQALAIRKKSLGPDHPDVATSLNNLAALYHSQGQYAKAEPLYQQALAIWKKSLGPDHPNVARSLNNLAALYDSQGQYAKAEPLYQQSLAILEKALPADHPNLATGMDNYAACLEKLNRNTEAKSWQARAQAIRESRTAGAATAK
jgi:tetratricopeptide (TPR) repeat protein